MSPQLSLIGILVAIVLLMYLAFKGIGMPILSPICVSVLAVFSGASIYELLSGPYMNGFSNFAKNYFLLLLMSAIFGKLMEESGAARGIAMNITKLTKKFPKHEKVVAILSIALINAVLTYGGVSLFVVSFTTMAIAKTLYQKLDIPWHLTICSALGGGTFTMTMLPGSPQLPNIIPTRYLGTTPMAAPVIGIIGSIIMVVLGIAYVSYALRKTEKAGEGFLPTGAAILEAMPGSIDLETNESLFRSLLPSIILFVVMNGFSVPPTMALIIACISVYVIYFNRFKEKNIKAILGAGTTNAMSAVVSTCSIIGFGAAVASVSGYQYVLNFLDNIPGSPLVQMIVAVEVAAGITASASGGLGLALENMSQRFLEMGLQPDVIHRFSAIACGGLDSLPHTSGFIVSASVNKLTHSQSYKHMFWLTVVGPIIVVIIMAIFYSITGIY